MTSVSKLLDRGRQTLIVWPVVRKVEPRRGTVEYHPDLENPVRLRVTTGADRSQIADLPGQIDVELVRCITRSFPRGVGSTWSKVELDGEEYDLAVPARYSPGPSRATSHWEFLLRSRSNLDATPIEDREGVPLAVRRTT